MKITNFFFSTSPSKVFLLFANTKMFFFFFIYQRFNIARQVYLLNLQLFYYCNTINRDNLFTVISLQRRGSVLLNYKCFLFNIGAIIYLSTRPAEFFSVCLKNQYLQKKSHIINTKNHDFPHNFGHISYIESPLGQLSKQFAPVKFWDS